MKLNRKLLLINTNAFVFAMIWYVASGYKNALLILFFPVFISFILYILTKKNIIFKKKANNI